MNQTVTTASVIRKDAFEVDKIKVTVSNNHRKRNYEIKKGSYYILEPINNELRNLKGRMVLVEGFDEIPAGYSVRVFLVEERREIWVALGELKSLFKD